MTYIYKDHEIYARVWESGSDLYEINKKGEITKSLDIKITHDDQQIVWYEVEAIDVDAQPFPTTTMFTELKTLDEAKAIVDRSIEYSRQIQ